MLSVSWQPSTWVMLQCALKEHFNSAWMPPDMKHQYFGDINDYRKYGLLRLLSGGTLRLGVCWMLTLDDGRTDGKFIQYLHAPHIWRAYDPPLFDALHQVVNVARLRSVHQAEQLSILPAADFYTHLLFDNRMQRQGYFQRMLQQFQDVDLVFFDPDNGIETASVKLGQKASSKFLYWSELLTTYQGGHSVLFYQHFRREERSTFIKRIAADIQGRIPATDVYAFHTAHVMFFLVAQPQHTMHFRRQIAHITEIWTTQIQVDTFIA